MLLTCRREFRRAAQAAGIGAAVAPAPEPFFVSVVVDVPSTTIPPERAPVARKRRARRVEATAAELEIDGVSMKIARGADAGVIAAVIDALKTAR